MQTLLAIADLLVVVGVVFSVIAAVQRGQSLLLTVVLALAMFIFGLVSLSAANGLVLSDWSPNHVAMLIFLVAGAVVLSVWWTLSPQQ